MGSKHSKNKNHDADNVDSTDNIHTNHADDENAQNNVINRSKIKDKTPKPIVTFQGKNILGVS